ncbi:MAG: hypothetical protein AAF436_00280 [Myxococcota bacterium]
MTMQARQALRAMFTGIFVLSILLSAYATGARAQAQQKKRQPRVIQLEEIVIEGRVQKPNAFYILNRSNLGYEVLELRTTFLRDVIRSVQEEPF